MSGYWDEFNLKGDTRKFRDTEAREQLATKAEIDGYYEEMTVGNAEQLISNVYVEDSEAYKYRTSGGSADIGNREYDEIVGGTIAWNQLVQNGNFVSADGWTAFRGTLSVDNNIATLTTNESGATENISIYRSISNIKTNHLYMICYDIKPSLSGNFLAGLVGSPSVLFSKYATADVWNSIASIVKPTGSITTLYLYGAATNEATVQYKNVVVFDLTAMFGSTIADYIYSLEQTTAGAGVAWFRKYFPEPYYAYNSGELISVEGLSSHDMVGFNQYTNGTAKVLGGNQYQITGTYTALSLDGETITPDSNGLFIPSATGTLTVTGGGDDTCVHLTWSGSRNGDYEEYVKHSYALDDSLTLRGIPKLSDGKLTFDGDIYASDGTVTRKYGIVDLGTLTWTKGATTSGHYRFWASLSGAKISPSDTYIVNIICTKYNTVTSAVTWNAARTGIAINNGTLAQVLVNDPDYYDSTAADFKTAMSGVYLVYELATLTTETAEPYQSPQIVDDYGTEEYVSTTIVPVGHNTKYMANSVDKLNHLPTLADSDGDYVIRQSGTQMSLIPLTQVKELPDAPSADGTYTLKVTVTDGEATYSWES